MSAHPSRLKFLVVREIKGWLDVPQIDIDPSHPWRIGWVYDETRAEKRWICPSLPSWSIKKEDVKSRKVFFYYEDEGPGWNDLIIQCKGTRITSTLNNLPIADYDGSGVLDDASHKTYNVGMDGHVALQLHRGAEISFALKRLKSLMSVKIFLLCRF